MELLSLRGCSKKLIAVIARMGTCADAYGCRAFLVGGIVRDILLTRETMDVDVVIEADAVAFAQMIVKKCRAKLTVHPQFSTATIRFWDGAQVDIAMARKEVYPHPGALPVVKPGMIREDLIRRDFTINALAVSINADNFGEIIDVHGGMVDLNKGLVRIMHEKSFRDDPTRIIRAVRFEQRFGFRFEAQTLRLAREAIAADVFATVTPVRFTAALKKIITEDDPIVCVERLIGLGALPVSGSGDTVARFVHHRRGECDDSDVGRWSGYLCALLDGVDEKAAGIFLARVSLTREERQCVECLTMTANLRAVLARRGLRPAEVYRLLYPLPVGYLRYLKASSTGVAVQRITQFLVKDRSCTVRITGHDVRQACAVSSGKDIGAILKAVLDAKVDNGFTTKRQELAAAKHAAARLRGE